MRWAEAVEMEATVGAVVIMGMEMTTARRREQKRSVVARMKSRAR